MNWPTDDAGIVALILQNEGGFVNIAADIGHATNFGISTDTLASWRKTPVTVQDVENLTVEEASQIYTAKYIVGPGFDQLSDIKLRAAMVDYGVLCGPVMAIQSLQRSLDIPVDGVCGAQTAEISNNANATPVINELSAARIKFHCARVTKQPDQLPFLVGWVNRALQYIE
jgi:lysozyme family protein